MLRGPHPPRERATASSANTRGCSHQLPSPVRSAKRAASFHEILLMKTQWDSHGPHPSW
ncbi:hypothetical protein ACTODO_01921 [Schaalia dentiphila ATCC 17982]|uniref:Uncharacterized protein n=1 Tax=Schaalia dentiphila ATCC 17982 TaxID=411466 RepID=A7BE20_9ACTO|nr:hypothetical protein ACTODO_01921 [Schaalia odontolytica ATCC 17982]